MDTDPAVLVGEFVGRWLGRKERPSFALVHVSESGPVVLDSFEPDELDAPSPGAVELAARFATSAQAHVGSSSRPQRYAVAASSARGRVLAQVFFRLCPPLLAGLEPGHTDTEPATPTGAMAQAMRHTEAFARLQAETTGASVSALVSLVKMLGAQVEAAEGSRLEYMRLAQQLLDRKQERDLEVRDAEAVQRRTEQGMNLLGRAVEVAAAHFTGATPVFQFLRSLRPEQADAILGAMDAEQLPMLRKIMESGAAAEALKGSMLSSVVDNLPGDGSVGGKDAAP